MRGGGVVSLVFNVVINVVSSFAIILQRKRELITLLECIFAVMGLLCECLCSISLLQGVKTWSVHFLVIGLAVKWLRVNILYSEQITYPYNQI